MPFSIQERNSLLQVKGVGSTVVDRLEQLGISNLKSLAQQDAEIICTEVAALVGTTCWKNSPQARRAIQAAIEFAKSEI